MFKYNTPEEFKLIAKQATKEFMKSKYIDDIIVLEFHNEFFFYVFKTKYNRDFLYDKLSLSNSIALYDVLFEHSLFTNGDLYDHVIKKVLPEKSKKTFYLNGAYCHLPLENECIIIKEDTISSKKKLVIDIPSITLQ